VRIAVLGCGSIGRRHLRNLVVLGERDLVAYDPDAGSRAKAGEELGCEVIADLEEVWDRAPSAALVTAPTHLHLPLALAAARRGCHLFIEKPLSHTSDGVAELRALAERAGLVTMVGCNMRFHPGPAAVKRLLDEGAIGRVLAARLQTGSYLPAWRPWLDYRQSYSARADQGGGALLDCIHEVDLALWYSGPGRLAGAVVLPAASLDIAVDGLAELLICHDRGALSSVHLNFVQRDYRRSCQIIGTGGTIYWAWSEPVVRVADGAGERCIDLAQGDTNQMYVDELRHFLAAVQSGTATTCPIDAGLAALQIVDDARRQAYAPAPEVQA
jgi:predicted dehydrogenase